MVPLFIVGFLLFVPARTVFAIEFQLGYPTAPDHAVAVEVTVAYPRPFRLVYGVLSPWSPREPPRLLQVPFKVYAPDGSVIPPLQGATCTIGAQWFGLCVILEIRSAGTTRIVGTFPQHMLEILAIQGVSTISILLQDFPHGAPAVRELPVAELRERAAYRPR